MKTRINTYLYFYIFLISYIFLLIVPGHVDAQTTSFSLCSGVAGAPILFKDFGRGSTQYNSAAPKSFGFTTTYTQKFAGQKTDDGMFSFQNKINDDFGVWHKNVLNHTPNDPNGYIMVVNANFDKGEFYRDTVSNLCIGSSYEFSVFLGNMFLPDAQTTYSGVKRPNVRFEIRTVLGALLATTNSGKIEPTNTFTWTKYGLSFSTPETSVILLIISDAEGGIGNDIAIDDIAFTPCTPATTAIKPINAVCNNAPATIEVRVYGNADYKYYQWQTSTDKGKTWKDRDSPGVKTGDAMDYTVSLPITSVSVADDSTIFRLVVATSIASLSEATTGCRAFVYSETTVLKVIDSPPILIPDVSILCAGSPPITLTGFSPAGGIISGTANITAAGVLTPSTAGTFNIKYEIGPGTGCGSSLTKPVTILPKPTVNAGPDQQLCANTPSFKLSGTITNSTTFLWRGGGGSFSPDNKSSTTTYVPTDAELKAGSVTLTLLNTDSAVCSSVKDDIKLTFEKNPEVNAGPDQVVCDGVTVLQLAGTIINAKGGIWSGGLGTFTPAATNATASYNATTNDIQSGKVTLTLTTTGSVLCSDVSDQVEISFIPIPKVMIPDTFACDGVTILLKSTMPPTGSTITPVYEWKKDGTALNKNVPDLSITKPGVYNVKVSLGQCTTNDDAVVTFNPIPVNPFKTNPKFCSDNTSLVELDAGPGLSYLWKPGNETTQKIQVTSTGKFSVLVTNEYNCSLESSTEVIEACPPSLYVSNAFSPNNDGKNDEYTVYGKHVANFKMYIFNRWGEVIFQSNEKQKVWDGNYLGEQMTVGVYPWIITYEGDSKEYRGPYKKEGSVTVVK